MNGSDRFVTFGRLTLPWPAVEAVIDAELRGVRLQADGDEIIVEPAGILTEEEKNNLRRWRWHVLAILAELGHLQTVQ